MLSRNEFRLVDRSLFFALFNGVPCIVEDRFEDFIDSSRDSKEEYLLAMLSKSTEMVAVIHRISTLDPM